MKQILSIILLIILVSCDKTQDIQEKKISFWHFWSEPNQKSVLDSIINEFTKKTGIEVETTELSWNDGKTKLLAAFNSNTAPDVIEFGSDWVAQFSSAGVLAEQNTNLDSFLIWTTEPCYWNDKIYAKPWIVDSRVLFYNQEILEKYGFAEPANGFQEMFDQCFAVSQDKSNDLNGFGINGPDPNRLYKKALIFSWSRGGDIIAGGKSVFNNILNYDALDFYSKMSMGGIIDNQKNLDDKFVEGKLAYTISGGWLIDKISKENPDLNYDIRTIPDFRGHKGVSFAGGEYLSINANSNKKKQAQKLIDFLTNGKNSIEFCKKVIEAGFPADKNYYNDPYYKAYPKRMKIAKQLESARMTPVHPRWLEIQDEIENAYERILFEPIYADSSIRIAHRKIQAILNN